jgi:membrane-associated phospholipid phosphatase
LLSAASVLSLALAITASSAAAPATKPPHPSAPDRPLTQIFRNLGEDIRALPSADTAIVLGTGAGIAVVLHPIDDNVSTWVSEQAPSGYTKIGRTIGDGWIQGGAALATYAVGVAAHHQPTAHLGSDLIRGQLLNAIVTRGTKLIAQRARPGSNSTDSFPSGHSSASFMTAAVLDGHFGMRVGAPAYAVAGFVAWTRVRDNAHWLTDTIIGATIGTLIGRTVTATERTKRWTIVPSASHNAVGIYVMRQ